MIIWPLNEGHTVVGPIGLAPEDPDWWLAPCHISLVQNNSSPGGIETNIWLLGVMGPTDPATGKTVYGSIGPYAKNRRSLSLSGRIKV